MFFSFVKIRRHYRDRRRQLRRIQLMEVPYRNSIADSEGRRSSTFISPSTPRRMTETGDRSTPTSPVKIGTFATAVATLVNRSRPPSQRRRDYDEMQETTKRQSIRATTVSIQEPIDDEDDKDYRVTVV